MKIHTQTHSPLAVHPFSPARLQVATAEAVAQDGYNAGARQPMLGTQMRPSARPADNKQSAAQLEAYLQQILSDPEAEAQMIKMLATLNATGQLKPVLHELASELSASGNIPPMPEAKRIAMVNQLAGMIDAQFQAHGMTPDTHGQVYESWDKLAEQNLGKVRNSQIPPRGPGELSAFTEPAFVAELEALQGAKFQAGNKITILTDGPESFAKRDELIANAKESIHLMTWAFYDDETGWETARKLAEKKAEGLDVKVIVDGQVAANPGHNETLDFMESKGVEVVRWRSSDRPYDGQHRKAMVVDNKVAIAGGLNVGNVYSHRGPEDGQKWRDTDVLVEGPAVGECARLIASVSGKSPQGIVSPGPVGAARSAVVNHLPGPKGDAHILLATLKAIQGASESVDIENAYVISTPDLRQSLLDALDRGVRVRVLTNSAESVDEPIVSAPILGSLPDLVAAGAEVYLKQGDTLHSKFMTVDGIFTSVGSYNLHPRSHRFEGEMTVNTLDTQVAAQLTASFEKDIQAAKRIHTPEEIVVPQNLLTMLAARYFFDHL